MKPVNTSQALILQLGDSCFWLSHQLLDWCGVAPNLEEDIALSNTALDLLGHARLWYELFLTSNSGYRDEDDLIFTREMHEFHQILLVELKSFYAKNAFAFVQVRQFLFDAWYHIYLNVLTQHDHHSLSAISKKLLPESSYHMQRSSKQIVHLGLATTTSHEYCQLALNDIWDYTAELFSNEKSENKNKWLRYVTDVFATANLIIPDRIPYQKGKNHGFHTEYFSNLLSEMQALKRGHQEARW